MRRTNSIASPSRIPSEVARRSSPWVNSNSSKPPRAWARRRRRRNCRSTEALGLAKGSSLYAGDSVVAEFPKHDRPLTKYPEIPITSSATIGGYTATASSYVFREAWQAFDNSDTTSWTSTYGYTGSPLTGDEYLQLELPVAIKVVKMYIKAYASTNYQHAPQDAELLGSNDGTNWVSLNTSTDLPLESYGASTWVHVNATQYYKYLRLKITKIYSGSTSYARVADLQYWGTEEGDESVDVVHRSVPNKPGTQHLDVYWDANDSNSYSFADSSNVYDLSGNGVTGTITGTNGFDTEYNAWVFDGSGDYIDGTLDNPSGDWVHSTSFWYRQDSVVTANWDYIYHIGTSTAGGAIVICFQLQWISRYGKLRKRPVYAVRLYLYWGNGITLRSSIQEVA